jgi:type IV secretory pathway TraG/TraD family ATPase VirD4
MVSLPIMSWIGLAIGYSRVKSKNSGSYGTADWADTKLVKKLGFLKPDGVVLGQTDNAIWLNKHSQNPGNGFRFGPEER